MARPKLDALQSYLLQLYDELVAKQKSTPRDPQDPVELGVPWPYVLDYPVSKPLDDPEKSKREILRRLKSFLYPYPEGNKSHKTFYRHLKSLELLNSLVTTPLLWNIRMVWSFQQIHGLELNLKRQKLSAHNFPLAFHREKLHLLFDHTKRIDSLEKKFEVSDQEWLGDYVAAVKGQLLKEGASYYPKFRLAFEPSHKLPVFSNVDNHVELYFALLNSFTASGRKSKKLARQVTAILCSRPECIRDKKLDLTPERIRKDVGDFYRKRPKLKGRMYKGIF
jgi:hypothetical protein